MLSPILQDAALQHSDMAEASQDPPQRLQRKIAKRVNFLDNVAKSHKLALLPRIKKKQKRCSQSALVCNAAILLVCLVSS